MRPAALEWINRASEDILAAHDLLANQSLTNVVAFHAQQCIEKSLKAILEEFSQEIPRIHKLEKQS